MCACDEGRGACHYHAGVGYSNWNDWPRPWHPVLGADLDEVGEAAQQRRENTTPDFERPFGQAA